MTYTIYYNHKLAHEYSSIYSSSPKHQFNRIPKRNQHLRNCHQHILNHNCFSKIEAIFYMV